MSDADIHLRLERERFAISEEFLNKYNRPGPRYTSYPTAPVWNESFGPDDFERVLADSNAKGAPVSLYMHIPFCESLCLFCACNVVIQKDKKVAPPYLEILKKEIKQFNPRVTRPRLRKHKRGPNRVTALRDPRAFCTHRIPSPRTHSRPCRHVPLCSCSLASQAARRLFGPSPPRNGKVTPFPRRLGKISRR